ncbi:MAG: hypothetical protein RLZZ502_454, partial [Pseudomonadota bacterium]
LESFYIHATRASDKLRDWLTQAAIQGQSLPRAQWLMPSPPGSTAAVSEMVCACVGVSKDSIVRQIASMSELGKSGDALNELKATLKCGTQCGSCVPELKKLLAQAS